MLEGDPPPFCGQELTFQLLCKEGPRAQRKPGCLGQSRGHSEVFKPGPSHAGLPWLRVGWAPCLHSSGNGA